MTIEQLCSPEVMGWFRDLNNRLNESHENLTNKQVRKEFSKWFKENESMINESLETKTLFKLNEGAFDAFFDDDDDDDDSPRKTKIEEEPVEEEPVSEPEPEPKPIEEPEPSKTSTPSETDDDDDDDSFLDVGDDEEEIKTASADIEGEDEEEYDDDDEVTPVDNSSHPKRNIFKVVNNIYDIICEDNANNYRHTPLSLLDTRRVYDMTALFAFTNLPNVDLSGWKTDSVKHMEGMFYKSTFDNDSICEWHVHNCADFKNMFKYSRFNQSLKKWKPAFIKVRDEHGEMVETRADLPIVGAYEDEEKERSYRHHKEKYKGFKYESKLKNIIDFDEFVINEGFKDVIKHGVNKVKNFFKTVSVKLNDFFVAFADKAGELLDVVSPYTTLNYISSGEVKGVTAYCDANNQLLNGVETEAPLLQDPSYYGIISDPDSIEYKNFKTFCSMINESKDLEFVEGDAINEERVGFNATMGGISGVRDINSKKLKFYIRQQMLSTPENKGKNANKPILIFGAPGVGKSTIPNSIISEWNKEHGSDPAHRKALIIAECGNMTPDGFSLPMPIRTDFDDLAERRPSVKKLSDELGLTPDDWNGFTLEQSGDSPKLWLPCYKPNSDPKKNEVLKSIANGAVVEYYDKDGVYHVEETCDGGLIMFDEFFRADESIFKILMQILLNRKYDQYKLGEKWGIICCSNRPNDDEEVGSIFPKVGAVVTTRMMTSFNFIPDFADWRKWAETDGGFDEVTLSFLVKNKDVNGEYTNWHNIDPEKHSEGNIGEATPRSWSNLMVGLNNIKENEGYSTIGEIPRDILEDMAVGALGEQIGMEYVEYLIKNADSLVSVSKIFEDPSYVIADKDLPSAAEIKEIIVGYVKSHWGPGDLPEPEILVNMFNFCDRSYPETKDNWIKEMHTTILKYLLTRGDKEANRPLKKYFKKCIDRYDVEIG